MLNSSTPSTSDHPSSPTDANPEARPSPCNAKADQRGGLITWLLAKTEPCHHEQAQRDRRLDRRARQAYPAEGYDGQAHGVTERERQRRRQEGPKAATAHPDQGDQEQVVPTGEQVIRPPQKRSPADLGTADGSRAGRRLDSRARCAHRLGRAGPTRTLVVALLIDGELLNRFRATPLSR